MENRDGYFVKSTMTVKGSISPETLTHGGRRPGRSDTDQGNSNKGKTAFSSSTGYLLANLSLSLFPRTEQKRTRDGPERPQGEEGTKLPTNSRFRFLRHPEVDPPE